MKANNPLMLVERWLSIGCICCIPALCLAQSGGIDPQPIPPGFDFPADQDKLLQLRDQQDVAGMRLHAWMVFAGMTQLAPGGEAIWETWHSQSETLNRGPSPQGVRKIQREFVVPTQFKKSGLSLQAAGISLASFVLYNEDTHKFIRQNKLHLPDTLNKLNASFPANTPLDKRTIKDLPRAAISTKTVWWVVRKTGLTAMPVWDPVVRKQPQPAMDIDTWSRAVAVDPTRANVPAAETADVSVFGQARPKSHVVPLSRFYSFPMDRATLDMVKRIGANIPNIDEAQAGDFLVLAAMHFTTKEIPDWVWATLWWHDKPDEGGFAAQRPAQLHGVWRNYLMDTSFSMNIPKESDQTPNATFNPWLEARFENGANSNCMTCHQRAVWPSVNFLPITRGGMDPKDPFFKEKTKVDFLWSLADLQP